MPPFLKVERRHYLLNQAALVDETLATSLLVSICIAYQVWGIIFRYWRNSKPACYNKDKITRSDFCMPPYLEVERRHYLLNQASLADETLASSL
jgi:hypothetical protein